MVTEKGGAPVPEKRPFVTKGELLAVLIAFILFGLYAFWVSTLEPPQQHARVTAKAKYEQRNKVEIAGTYYGELNFMLMVQPRMKPYVKVAMADGKVTLAEYDWIAAKEKDIGRIVARDYLAETVSK